MVRRCIVACALILSALGFGPVAVAQTAGCQFVLGFMTLHDLDPKDVGSCVDDQSLAQASGDQQQHTTNGLLAWRKADNWTAFTDGYRTWINGPNGLVTRLNTQRYSWEADFGAPGTTAIGDSTAASGLSKIQHIVIIMQENRSFDHYFGTYPGAEGLPRQNGQFTTCVPDPKKGACVAPYHNGNDGGAGGPHSAANATGDVDGGKMDGFIAQDQKAGRGDCAKLQDPNCTDSATADTSDVMGYRDAREIPNYWAYAQNFILQDHMFEPNASWSLPSHLYLLSEWAAKCSQKDDPSSCVNELDHPDIPPDFVAPAARASYTSAPNFAWTDMTYLMFKNNVSWKYYVAEGTEPDCEDDTKTCTPVPQRAGTPGIWNPLAWFTTVHQDNQLNNIQPLNSFYADAKAGNLAKISWFAPAQTS